MADKCKHLSFVWLEKKDGMAECSECGMTIFVQPLKGKEVKLQNKELTKLLRAGQKMSNVFFNISQGTMAFELRATARERYQEWDAAIAEYRQGNESARKLKG